MLGDAVSLFCLNVSAVKKNTEVLLDGSMKTDLGANA